MCDMYQISIANSSYILPAPSKTLLFSPPDPLTGVPRSAGTRMKRGDDGGKAAMTNERTMPAGLEIRGPMQPGYETVLTPAALEFVADLTRRFGARVADLL